MNPETVPRYGRVPPVFVCNFSSSSSPSSVLLYSSFPPGPFVTRKASLIAQRLGRLVYIFVPNVRFSALWPGEGM